MSEFIGIIQTVGFPIFVSLWLMRMIDRRLARIEDFQSQLLQQVATIVHTLDVADDHCLPPKGDSND